MPSFSCTVTDPVSNELRLDRYIAENLKLLSRSQIKARKLKALLNGKDVKISRLLKNGDRLELSWDEAESTLLIPQYFPLDVIYEDSRVIVVNKPQGMVVHPGAGNRQGTLANALLYRKLEKTGVCLDAANIDTASIEAASTTGIRPGIVHRLDKDTSGAIIAAWDGEALAFLSDQFKAGKVRKTYAALVHGCPKNKQGRIEKKITRSRRDRKVFTVSDKEGRNSITYYKLVRSFGNYSLLLLRPKTGRTHQLRVHLKYLGNPILGDPIYGCQEPHFKNATLMLHAKSLSLVLPPSSLPPAGHDHPVLFRTAMPERFKKYLLNYNSKPD